MRVGIVGLGRMGLNMALNLMEKNVDVLGYDASKVVLEEARNLNVKVHDSLDGLIESLGDEKVVMLSTPAGKITNDLVKILIDKLQPGDIIIDSGNSYYKDSIKNYELARERQIEFLDCGTSGGIEGARCGACLMVGGNKETFEKVEVIFKKLACENGYLYTGAPGSGHFLKMIHNGIEYGMMQAIGEGFEILHESQFDYDLEKVASVWNHGSVIRSWLMELVEKTFKEDPTLENVKGIIEASGEGKWTVQEALDLNVSIPVIANSLFVRSASQKENCFSNRVVAMMRYQFGGHRVFKEEE